MEPSGTALPTGEEVCGFKADEDVVEELSRQAKDMWESLILAYCNKRRHNINRGMLGGR